MNSTYFLVILGWGLMAPHIDKSTARIAAIICFSAAIFIELGN